VVDQRGEGRLGASDTYDGRAGSALVRLLDLPRVEVYDAVTSTMDVAHALAESGAPAGTMVLAEQQTAGRGRGGRSWQSAAGAGIWLSLIERPRDPAVVETLSLRVGLAAARVLDRWTAHPVQVKWPNDLFVRGAKLAGILVEARWREERLDWAAIGVGINFIAPRGLGASALNSGTPRVEVLAELVPAIRAAAAALGPLSDLELAAFGARDLARGRRCREPAVGIVAGLDRHGALLVTTAAGTAACRSGSLVLEEEPA
jgi:BirA family transcriptional regulator, biotin operon repressor / biotin---[acetyl-CoA-carboxylase] ligase